MPLPPLLSVDIPRLDGAVLHVDDAAALSQIFFATEVSSLGSGSYDARTLTTHPHQVDREDVRVLNASFRAMILKVYLWEPLFEAGDLPWLVALGTAWDLALTDDSDWEDLAVVGLVEAAVGEVISVKGRGVAQATKLLHLKRPALVPVIDSNVAKALGAKLSQEASVDTRVRQVREILLHFRDAAVSLRDDLEEVQAHLRAAGIDRSLARILDALIWCSEAEAWVAMSELLARWRSDG